jgi:D-arabinose 1-dehydrogenase-like Zn-dependent alcohol dehydrogenase
MKAAVLTKPNKPFRIEDIREEEPGVGQVRIRMRASGFCGTDIHVWRGNFQSTCRLFSGTSQLGQSINWDLE